MINYPCDCMKNKHLKKLVEALNNDEVVILPTDTIYGFVAKYSKKNVEKINELKGANKNKPLALITNDLKNVSNLIKWDEFQKKEIVKYLNTPTTLILKGKKEKKIGIRIPEQVDISNLFVQLINEVDFPLISSSVNEHGKESLNKYRQIKKLYKGKVCIIIKEKAKTNKASKIVDLSEGKTKIVRD